MNLRFAGIALAGVIAPLFLVSGAWAQAPIKIIDQNWEGANPPLFGYAFGTGASATQTVQAGAGVGGSNAAVLDATLGDAGSGVGLQTNTTSNPNTTVSDLSKISISFDARVTTTPIGNVEFYVQTWPGVYSGSADGIRSTTFAPTDTYKTYSFTLADMTKGATGDVVPTNQTMQISWQIGTFDNWPANSHDVIQIDNVHVTAVPAPGSEMVILMGLTAGAPLLRRRRASR